MKNLKTVLLLLIATTTAFAQQGKFRQKIEQVRSLKVAFITSELSLTPEESAKFWPVYNAFEDKQREIRKQKVTSYLDRRDADALDKMTDKEATALLTQIENNEDQLHQLRKKLIADLKAILPAKKIIRLKKAEDDFNKKLLQQYRNKGPKK